MNPYSSHDTVRTIHTAHIEVRTVHDIPAVRPILYDTCVYVIQWSSPKTGSIGPYRAQKNYAICCFFLLVYCKLRDLWVLYYSKMANWWFLVDSNTFWMISGTSKMSLNIDPINGQIWTRGPRIYGFYYTKILKKILESIWEHP